MSEKFSLEYIFEKKLKYFPIVAKNHAGWRIATKSVDKNKIVDPKIYGTISDLRAALKKWNSKKDKPDPSTSFQTTPQGSTGLFPSTPDSELGGLNLGADPLATWSGSTGGGNFPSTPDSELGGLNLSLDPPPNFQGNKPGSMPAKPNAEIEAEIEKLNQQLKNQLGYQGNFIDDIESIDKEIKNIEEKREKLHQQLQSQNYGSNVLTDVDKLDNLIKDLIDRQNKQRENLQQALDQKAKINSNTLQDPEIIDELIAEINKKLDEIEKADPETSFQGKDQDDTGSFPDTPSAEFDKNKPAYYLQKKDGYELLDKNGNQVDKGEGKYNGALPSWEDWNTITSDEDLPTPTKDDNLLGDLDTYLDQGPWGVKKEGSKYFVYDFKENRYSLSHNGFSNEQDASLAAAKLNKKLDNKTDKEYFDTEEEAWEKLVNKSKEYAITNGLWDPEDTDSELDEFWKMQNYFSIINKDGKFYVEENK